MIQKLQKIITDKEGTKEFIYSFIKERIEKNLGKNDFHFSIEDLQIREYPRIEIDILIDNREIKEDIEYHKSDEPNKRKIEKIEIPIFDYKTKKYSFSDVGKETFFRVKNSENTTECYKCNGEKEVTCSKCSGEKINKCANCSGIGHTKCYRCMGKGKITCGSCNGKGIKTQGYGDKKKTVICSSCGGNRLLNCNRCDGVGYKICRVCEGDKIVPCINCDGNGLVLCGKCKGYGFFDVFLNVISKLEIKKIHQNLNGNPNVDYLIIESEKEEFDYTNNFLYKFNLLKNLEPNFKTLVTQYNDDVNKKAIKISFSKSICYTIEFNVLLAQNNFKFEYSSNDFITYSNFDSSISYTKISEIPIEKDFVQLSNNKNYLISKIGKPVKNIVEQIKEYENFKKIISSKESNSAKLNNIRSLKLIQTQKFEKFLQNRLFNRYCFLSLLIVIGLIVGMLYLTGLRFLPTLISITGISVGYFLSCLIFRNKIKRSSLTSTLSMSIVVLIAFFLITSFVTVMDSIKFNNDEFVKTVEINKKLGTQEEFRKLKLNGILFPSESIILANGSTLKSFLHNKDLIPNKNNTPDSVIVFEPDKNTKNYAFLIPKGWKHYAYDGYLYVDGTWQPKGTYKLVESEEDTPIDFNMEEYLSIGWDKKIEITYGYNNIAIVVKKKIINISGVSVEYCYLDASGKIIKDNCFMNLKTCKRIFNDCKLSIYDDWLKNK